MGQVFRQLYYHVVWATKNREPQVTDAVRPHVFDSIRSCCQRLNCTRHALNKEYLASQEERHRTGGLSQLFETWHDGAADEPN